MVTFSEAYKGMFFLYPRPPFSKSTMKMLNDVLNTYTNYQVCYNSFICILITNYIGETYTSLSSHINGGLCAAVGRDLQNSTTG